MTGTKTISAEDFAASSAIKRLFSLISSLEKPRFLCSFSRTASPSRISTVFQRDSNSLLSASAKVLFPDPLKPVNQRTIAITLLFYLFFIFLLVFKFFFFCNGFLNFYLFSFFPLIIDNIKYNVC